MLRILQKQKDNNTKYCFILILVNKFPLLQTYFISMACTPVPCLHEYAVSWSSKTRAILFIIMNMMFIGCTVEYANMYQIKQIEAQEHNPQWLMQPAKYILQSQYSLLIYISDMQWQQNGRKNPRTNNFCFRRLLVKLSVETQMTDRFWN